jgi:hypothetical protein
MASYNQYTGTDCEYGHPEYYQVIVIKAWGHAEERHRGPTCWYADCPAHTQWSLQRGRAG